MAIGAEIECALLTDAFRRWSGYDLEDISQQKILLVVGPPRSGRGTITRVLAEMIGPASDKLPSPSASK